MITKFCKPKKEITFNFSKQKFSVTLRHELAKEIQNVANKLQEDPALIVYRALNHYLKKTK